MIYTLSPRRAVPCSEELVLCDGGFGAAFAVEEDNENGIDPVALFINSGRNDDAQSNPPILIESNQLVSSDNSSGAPFSFAIEEDTIDHDSVPLFVDSNHDPGTVYPLNLGMYTPVHVHKPVSYGCEFVHCSNPCYEFTIN